MTKEKKEGSNYYTGEVPGSPTILRMPSASLILRVIVEVNAID